MGKVMCFLDSNTRHFEIFIQTYAIRMEFPTSMLVIGYGKVLSRRGLSQGLLRQQLAYAMTAELHMMRHMRYFAKWLVWIQIKGVELSMQRSLLISESKAFL